MTLLRIALAALLFGASAWLGRAKARKLDLRTRALGDVLKFCRQFETLVRVGGRALPDALAECARRSQDCWTGGLADILAQSYIKRTKPSGIWAAALTEAAKDCEEASALSSDDRRVLALFGDQLASSDMRAIGEGFAFLYARLGEQMQAADRDRTVKGRLYGSIGTLAGLAAAIVVL
jgi:stage III sporulation protein AB